MLISPKQEVCGSDVGKVVFNHLEGCRSVNFPQVSSPRTYLRLRFYLSTYEVIGVCSFPKSGRSVGPNVPKVLFNHLEECRSVNFPQVSGPRTQECLRSWLSTYENIGVC